MVILLSHSFTSAQLKTLIGEAESRGLRFVYALSPGQDIVFSSSCDLTLLKRKLRQVKKSSLFSWLAPAQLGLFWLFCLTTKFTNSYAPVTTFSPLGDRTGLSCFCPPVWWYWSLHVPGWYRGLFLIRSRPGHRGQWDLPFPGGTACLPVLSHW